MRVLAFSPYAAWKFHTNYETTILRACQIRGAEVKVILCDAALNECDMYAPNRESRPINLCDQCQSMAKQALDESGLSYEWLGKYLSKEERQEVFDWAQTTHPHEFPTAIFRGFPVGDWVITSVVSGFRKYPIPLDDWRTVSTFRGFLYAAAITCIALEHIFELWNPDAMLLFNGRLSVTRVVFNLARLRGIRVLTHEHPQRPGTLMLHENAACNSNKPFIDFFRHWQEIPLVHSQLTTVVRWLQERRYGLGWNKYQFTRPPLGGGKGYLSSGKQPNRKLIVLFTSSNDEFAGDSTQQTPFPSQDDWILRVVDWVARNPQHDLVIRAHPGLAGTIGFWTGRSTFHISFLESLQERLPANVRLVLPNSEISSYDLMDNADLGLVYGSTAGIEMLALGIPLVVVPGFAMYESVPSIILLDDPNKLMHIMDYAVTLKASSDYQRYAFRYIYRYYYHFQLPFTLVTMKNSSETELKYHDNEVLKQGNDPALDDICGFLLKNKALHKVPSVNNVSSADEDRFFYALSSAFKWVNNPYVRFEAKLSNNKIRVIRMLRKASSLRNVPRRIRHFFKS